MASDCSQALFIEDLVGRGGQVLGMDVFGLAVPVGRVRVGAADSKHERPVARWRDQLHEVLEVRMTGEVLHLLDVHRESEERLWDHLSGALETVTCDVGIVWLACFERALAAAVAGRNRLIAMIAAAARINQRPPVFL